MIEFYGLKLNFNNFKICPAKPFEAPKNPFVRKEPYHWKNHLSIIHPF